MAVLEEKKKKEGRSIGYKITWIGAHFMVPSLGPYHGGHLNRLTFLWKFIDKHMVFKEIRNY